MSVKWIVVSDVHYDGGRLERLLPSINSSGGCIFCGDGAAEFMRVWGGIVVPTVCVRGNNDFYCNWGDDAVVEIGGKKIFVTHGHRLGVKRGLSVLASVAKDRGCDAAFFGHTHEFCNTVVNGVRLINAGALCNGSYATVEFDKNDIVCKKCSAL